MIRNPADRRILALIALSLALCVLVVAVATASYQLGVSERSEDVRELKARVADLEAEVDVIGDDVSKLIE